VRAVAIAILIDVRLGNGLTPRCATLEFDVVDVDTGVNDVDINTFSSTLFVLVLGERRESKFLAMRYASKTL